MDKLAILALVAGTCMISTTVQAVELVANGSFENPAPDTTWNYSNPDGPYLTGSFSSWTSNGQSGVWQPSALMFTSIPDGRQAGWTGSGPFGGGSLTQSFSQTISVGDTITMGGEFGDRSNLFLGYGGVTAGTVSLFTSTNVLLLQASVSGPGTTGTWASFSLSTAPGSLDGYAGQSMRIELSSANGTQANYDKISVQVVPEPTSLMALGLFGLGLLRKRRAQ